jgi:lysophospholipase L1-like esterase
MPVKPRQPEKPKPREWKRYVEKISQAKEVRENFTKQFLSKRVIRKPENFVKKSCVALGLRPTESLLLNVLKIQRKLRFPLIPENKIGAGPGYAECADGKLGPYTLKKIMENSRAEKKLRPFFKSTHVKKRRKFVERQKLPKSPPKKSKTETPKQEYQQPKEGVSFSDTLPIGDSLSVGFGYAKSPLVKGGMSVTWMRRRLEKNPELVKRHKAFTVLAGANDVSYRSAEEILLNLEKIYTFILKNNPGARIVAITLPPMAGYRGFRNKSEIIRKVNKINRGIKALAARYPNQISVVDIYPELENPERSGYSKLRSDGLHLNRKYYRAIDRMIRDEVEKGSHEKLAEYLPGGNRGQTRPA